MPACQSQNLPELLADAEAVYRDLSVASPSLGEVSAAQRTAHLLAGVRLGIDDPEALRRLREVTGSVRRAPSLNALLPRVLDGALSLTDADFGNLQLLDPVSGSLRLVTQFGFDSRFVEYFAVVKDASSACGRALGQQGQIIIGDVTDDRDFASHLDIAALSGFRAVQSTPLFSRSGYLVGVISTHFTLPRRPSDLTSRIMELYADVAGQAVAEHLGLVDTVDPVGRAVISAMFDTTGGEFAQDVVTRLFDVGLRLNKTRGDDGDRLTRAMSHVDYLIRNIRVIVLDRATDD
ncbi:hypothetical protein GCM10029964_065900 [Kibdelosporangium lantanae]